MHRAHVSRCKLRTPVGDSISGDAKDLNNMVDKERHCFFGRGEFKEGNEISHLAEPVNNGVDDCVALGWRTTGEKIQ